jgi:hypothetical protein
LVKVSTGVGILQEAPKFKLVKVSISPGIISLNEESTLNAIPTLHKNPSKWFGYP